MLPLTLLRSFLVKESQVSHLSSFSPLTSQVDTRFPIPTTLASRTTDSGWVHSTKRLRVVPNTSRCNICTSQFKQKQAITTTSSLTLLSSQHLPDPRQGSNRINFYSSNRCLAVRRVTVELTQLARLSIHASAMTLENSVTTKYSKELLKTVPARSQPNLPSWQNIPIRWRLSNNVLTKKDRQPPMQGIVSSTQCHLLTLRYSIK